MCKFFFTIAFLCALTLNAHAQSGAGDVSDVVDRFFDAMRAGDSTAVRSVLHPEARLMTTGVQNGKPALHVVSIHKFVEAIGTPHEAQWDERIWNLAVHLDDRLATAWMNYAFFIGDEFSHCGVNAMQLYQGENGWKIIQITDTRRTEGCEIPEDR